jgi:hypothetical protein
MAMIALAWYYAQATATAPTTSMICLIVKRLKLLKKLPECHEE